MKPLRHIMILASAGSGKTYALTNRFVELLARGALPERIVALTFTRKAAGEFFDGILNKLAGAAGDPAKAARLARDIDAPSLGPADFLRMLRTVTDAMHRLRMGTLDGFFARIVRVFPFELGLTGEFELLEEHSARLQRQRVMQRMFTRAGGGLATAQREFIEAFKRATFGAEEKQLGTRLDEFLDAHHECFLAAPDESLWGDPRRIWPEGNPWLGAPVDRAAAIRALRDWVGHAASGDRQRARWESFLAAVEAWSPGMALAEELEYVLKKVIADWAEVAAGRAVLEFDRKRQELDAGACAGLADLTRHVVGGELRRRLAITRGIHAVLRGYEVFYEDGVRSAGMLTFGDVQRLLQPGSSGRVLSSTGFWKDPGGEGQDMESLPDRLAIDYRLDAGIDHWLLDEFQDTSHGQWSVLRNLIDEAVQDTAGTRSFFCVGDVKQAIFTWREGDPRLFREIFRHYNAAAPGAVVAQHLVESWRSGPPVIEMVNAVFGAGAVIGGLFPGRIAETWNAEWRAHASAVPGRTGQAALLLAEDETGRWECVLRLLREIRPLERGLSCAVLVPKNATATDLADYLRRAGGVPALAESDLHVCIDNPLGAGLLALFRAAAHPGDTLAWEHVQMTPLGEVLTEAGVTTREDATLHVLGQVHAGGFAEALEWWLRRIEPRLQPDDGFSRMRARQFVEAAGRFDRTGSRDVAEFVQFMERHVVREPESAAVVRVMTIHKSKGLGFDVVILPDLQGKRLDERRGGLAVQKTPEREIAWIMELPPKLYCQADEVLSRHVADAEAEAGYEALSLLYVALTRAKRGLYAIVEPVGKSVSRNYPKLLSETLGDDARPVRVGGVELTGIWSSGDCRWHEAVSMEAPDAAGANKATAVFPKIDENTSNRILRREARRPSARDGLVMPAAQAFSLESSSRAEFGAEVHALLAEIEWFDGTTMPVLDDAWRRRGVSRAVRAEVMSCLEAGALADIWKRRPRTEVWLERSFEVVLDDVWISGIFDRVLVEHDAAGSVVHATVFDFKTEAVGDPGSGAAAALSHAPQLNLYRKVACLLTGLEPADVRCELVFTGSRERRVVPV